MKALSEFFPDGGRIRGGAENNNRVSLIDHIDRQQNPSVLSLRPAQQMWYK